MKKFLFYFALLGWILGLIVHILSIADIDIAEKLPFIWLLHLGIFVVWIPVIFDFKNNKELIEYQQSGIGKKMNPSLMFKIIFKDTPNWLSLIAIVGFFYAIINFMIFMSSQGGTPEIKDGQYILESHGQLIKKLTEQEYHHYKANELRGFSGHWILFYGFATAVLFKYSRFLQTDEKTKTNNK